jgi:hypothetical protein
MPNSYTTSRYPQYVGAETQQFSVALTAATVTTGGAVASVLNPFGVDVIITRAIVRTTTQSTGAATVDIGVTSGAATSSDTLIDGLSLASAAVLSSAGGTNGAVPRLWASTDYVTATASATLAGMAGGVLYLECIKA